MKKLVKYFALIFVVPDFAAILGGKE